MLKTFEDLQKQVAKQVFKSVSIDNVVFRLHYRLTFWILLVRTPAARSTPPARRPTAHLRAFNDVP